MKEYKDIERLQKSFDDVEIPIELDFVIEKAIQQGKRIQKRNYISKALVAAASVAFVFVSSAYIVNNMKDNSDISSLALEQNTEVQQVKDNVVENTIGEIASSNTSELNKPEEANKAIKSDETEKANNKGEVKGSFVAGIVGSVRDNILTSKGAILAKDNELPKLKDKKHLEKLLEENYKEWSLLKSMKESALEESKLDMKSNSLTVANDGSDMDIYNDYSATNLQVEGVDEGDVVKTDGEYIYKLHYGVDGGYGIYIIKAEPAENMSLIGDIKITKFNPTEIFINGSYLVVVGEENFNYYNQESGVIEEDTAAAEIYRDRPYTIIEVYDIKDKSNVSMVRKIEIEGQYSTARIVEKDVYVISNKRIYKEWFEEKDTSILLPRYKDSSSGDKEVILDYNSIYYCPESIEPNYIIVSSFNLDKLKDEVKITSTLGSSNNMYSSKENLYIAGSDYNDSQKDKTTIYKFHLNNGDVKFISSGEIPGNILNQFSMDEYNDYFRVTTTKNSYSLWKSKPTNDAPLAENNSTNNLYILDKDMKVVGKLEDLAKGERIYSTRFMGDRAYMVTFKTTDPLFVIDLKSVENPKVLGELKIPGYSDHLQPYDENHLIGMGRDVEVVTDKTGEVVYQKGIKLALFDVTDVNSPKEKFSTVIGDRGTESDALYNHKAILFSRTKSLLAFPISVATVTDQNKSANKGIMPPYGTINFIGAYVYNVDLEKGFTLKGGITHLKESKKDNKEQVIQEFDWDRKIERIIYIGDRLYTISNNAVKANDIEDLKEVGNLELK